eukprot:scaffold8630_cov115-Isochrysis_galbana.AAC.3
MRETKTGIAPLSMMTRACSEVPEATLVSAHAASNANVGSSWQCRNWTSLGTTPAAITSAIGGFLSIERSLRSRMHASSCEHGCGAAVCLGETRGQGVCGRPVGTAGARLSEAAPGAPEACGGGGRPTQGDSGSFSRTERACPARRFRCGRPAHLLASGCGLEQSHVLRQRLEGLGQTRIGHIGRARRDVRLVRLQLNLHGPACIAPPLLQPVLLLILAQLHRGRLSPPAPVISIDPLPEAAAVLARRHHQCRELDTRAISPKAAV